MTAASPPRAARQLWQRATNGSAEPADVSAAAARLCTQLRQELGRWIGIDGYRALIERALAMSRAEHPALDGFSCLCDETGTADLVQAHGAAHVAAGMVGMLSVLIELLGRIIGDEMAVHLVEQIDFTSAHAPASTGSKDRRNG